MSQTDWTVLTGSLGTSYIRRGATAGIVKPNGGGNFVYGFNSIELDEGVSALINNQASFAPMAKGGSIRAAIKRGAGSGYENFAPFIFIGLQGTNVTDNGYILGLGDDDPHHIVLRKGALSDGLPDAAPTPTASPRVLMRSSASFANDTWLHLRLDMIVEGTGDVILQVYQNDLDTNPVSAPVWELITGMEGPQYPTITGFVDDALGVTTGIAPYTSGRAGFGHYNNDVGRQSFFDHIEIGRQL
jgi:hypothetical protein